MTEVFDLNCDVCVMIGLSWSEDYIAAAAKMIRTVYRVERKR